jgi:hypothetical protein
MPSGTDRINRPASHVRPTPAPAAPSRVNVTLGSLYGLTRNRVRRRVGRWSHQSHQPSQQQASPALRPEPVIKVPLGTLLRALRYFRRSGNDARLADAPHRPQQPHQQECSPSRATRRPGNPGEWHPVRGPCRGSKSANSPCSELIGTSILTGRLRPASSAPDAPLVPLVRLSGAGCLHHIPGGPHVPLAARRGRRGRPGGGGASRA